MIDVYKDELTMRVNDEQVTFKIPKAMRFSNEGLEEVSMIKTMRFCLVPKHFQSATKFGV